jgi:hypothetical protein
MSRLPSKAGEPAQDSRTRKDEVGSMKPKWIRFRKRRKQTDPEGVLQAGLLMFSATCGATLLLAACNGG